MKKIGIMPIQFNNIENKYPKDLDSCNITRMFISNMNNIYTAKKTKLHKNNNNILDTFNKSFNTDLKIETTQIINYGWIDNVQLYLLVVNDYKMISDISIHEITFHKEEFCWKPFMDRFKETTIVPSDIYSHILEDSGIFNNVHFDFNINIDNESINIKDIYSKLTNIHYINTHINNEIIQ